MQPVGVPCHPKRCQVTLASKQHRNAAFHYWSIPVPVLVIYLVNRVLFICQYSLCLYVEEIIYRVLKYVFFLKRGIARCTKVAQGFDALCEACQEVCQDLAELTGDHTA